MTHPVGLSYGLAVIMLSVALYCMGRLVSARRLGRQNRYDVSAAHALMGLAMVGMLVPRWNELSVGFWEVVFAAMALYFATRTVQSLVTHGRWGAGDFHRVSHPLIHMVMACAMLYMYWLGMPAAGPTTVSMAMSGPPVGVGDPGLTLVILGVLTSSAIWQLDSIGNRVSLGRVPLSVQGSQQGATGSDVGGPASAGDPKPWLAPRLEVGCHIAMCFAMGYMLMLLV